MRPIPVAAAAVLLLLPVGCDRPDATPPAGAPGPVPTTPPPAAPPAQSTLPLTEGSALAFVDAAGTPTATLSCDLDGLRIVIPGFQPIGSEDRLSIGADGEAFALVADLTAPGPGVTASGSPDPDLLDRLARGEALFAMYGQQAAGPLTAASPAGLQVVVSACRRRE